MRTHMTTTLAWIALPVTLSLMVGCGGDEAPAPKGAADQVKEQALNSNAGNVSDPPETSRTTPPEAEPSVNEPAGSTATEVGDGERIQVGNLTMMLPESWEEQTPTSAMRAAQYGVGENGQLVIFTGIGGGVDNNINRWIGQVGNQATQPVRDTIQEGGLVIHTIEMTGTYQGMTMTGNAAAQSGTTFFGAIIEGASPEVQIRLTVEAGRTDLSREEWDAMINSIVRG